MDVTQNIVNYDIQIGYDNRVQVQSGVLSEQKLNKTHCHISEEQVTPIIFYKKQQTNDKQEVAEADEDDNNHPRVNWKLK